VVSRKPAKAQTNLVAFDPSGAALALSDGLVLFLELIRGFIEGLFSLEKAGSRCRAERDSSPRRTASPEEALLLSS
jgi:hypothetical protein